MGTGSNCCEWPIERFVPSTSYAKERTKVDNSRFFITSDERIMALLCGVQIKLQANKMLRASKQTISRAENT